MTETHPIRGPLTFQSLTARQVFTSIWETPGYYDPQHLRLTESPICPIPPPPPT